MKSWDWFRPFLWAVMLIFGFGNTMANTSETLLVFDNENYTELPKNWRQPIGMIKKETPYLFLEGLNKLQASASGQFSEATLVHAFAEAERAKIWIIDLRGEAHGFLDGKAVSWYGYRNLALQNISLQDILQEEARLLESLKKQNTITVYQIEKKVGGEIQQVKAHEVKPQRIESEAELARRLGFHYKRFAITDRHPPSDATLDEFIQFIINLPEDHWLHFHCRAGKGRSSTFIVLYDILQNGTTVSLDIILQRHAYFGSKDLTQMPTLAEDQWKVQPAQNRLKMIELFYRYRNDPDFLKKSWKIWKKEHTA